MSYNKFSRVNSLEDDLNDDEKALDLILNKFKNLNGT